MANREFIAAKDLPVTEAEEVNVLVVDPATGEMAQKPGANLGGSGGETPDLVMALTGYLSGSSAFNDGVAELSIIAGTPSAIKAKLEAGESPVVKMKHVRGAYGDYSHSRYEYDVYVVTYGEDYWFSTIAISSSGDSLYKVSGGFDADGNITWSSVTGLT